MGGYVARDRFELNGIDEATKDALKDAAFQKFGKANAALMIRALISDFLHEDLFSVDVENANEVDLSSDNVRIGLSFPEGCLAEIDRRAELRLCSRNYYISNLVYAHLGRPQLMIDEIECLRASNYQMAKIGTNLNHIAKAYLSMVKSGRSELIPEFAKSLNKLKLDITKHTATVLKILEDGTYILENKGKGRGQAETEK